MTARFPLSVLSALALLATSPLYAQTSSPTSTTASSKTIEAFGLKEVAPRGGLPNVASKLTKGEEVRVAYLGGSITNAPGWRVLSLNWLRSQYPQAKLSEIHAAISGTGSDFGAFRLGREVLEKKPDLLFVEFAVNDSGAKPERIIRAMEGIVRQTWRANPSTDICFVYTLGKDDLKTLQGGQFQRSAATMERVAEHYGIPSIHFGIEVTKLEQEGKIIFTAPLPKTDAEKAALGDKIVFAGDSVHPHVETGHPFYLAAIQRSWPQLVQSTATSPHTLPPPVDPLNWEKATLLPISEIEREGDWQRLPPNAPPLKGAGGPMKEVWSASKPGTALAFRFKGRTFGLYGIKGPDAGQFKVTIDDQSPITAAQFDAYCTTNRWRINPWVYPQELPDGEHNVRIELLGTTPDKETILKARNGTIDDPAQRNATNLHVSAVLVLGEIVAPPK